MKQYRSILSSNIMGFIYKITNIITNKCYIGETKKKNPELRWNEHKYKIEKGIGCPALQDAVRKYGILNFKFEVLIICFDKDRYKYEIEYIKKYNSISPNGYNLTCGGEGGGFYGKKHSEETISKIVNVLKQKYVDDPELKKRMSERQLIVMNAPEVRDKIKNGIKNSKKWKLAKENKRLGNYNCRKHNEETKAKISESLKKKWDSNENKISGIDREKHRLIMAKARGIKVQQCDEQLNVINTYISLSEAERVTGVSTATIQNGINDTIKKLRCGFIWKKIE